METFSTQEFIYKREDHVPNYEHSLLFRIKPVKTGNFIV